MSNHIALYRTYRPQDFDHLVGQDAIKTTLLNAAKSGRIAQVYLFSGPRGTGKTTTARLIAKILNCTNLGKDGNPCNACDICKEIQEGHMIDVIEVDGASNRGIDEVRDLREKALFTPTHAKKKVFIIDEVHMLTKEAFNALLKTLEEPVAHINFILATTELQKVPVTILSRCQHFEFRRISLESMTERLTEVCKAEKIKAEPEALKLIARAADGSLRDALVLVEQLTRDNAITANEVQENLGLVRGELVETFLALLTDHQSNEAFDFINTIYADGVSLVQFTREVIERLREKMMVAMQEGDLENAKRYSTFIETFVQALNELKDTVIPQLPLELAIVELEGTISESRNSNPETRNIKSEIRSSKLETRLPKPEPLSPLSPTPYALRPAESPSTPQSSTEQLRNNPALSLARIREHWAEIISKVTTPKVRLALRTAKLGSLDGTKLTLIFPSQFEVEQTRPVSHRSEIEHAIKQILSEEVQIACTHDTAAKPVSITTETLPRPPKNASLREAVDILGGTLLEE